jgi:hypothetical protein
MVGQEKLKCSSCGTSLINVAITQDTTEFSKVQAVCWKCPDKSFVKTIRGKYSLLDTTVSKISSMKMEDDKMVIYTQKQGT